MKVPTITDLPSFGTMAPDAVAIHNSFGNKVNNPKQSAKKKRSKIEEEVNFNQLMKMQEFNIPIVNASFIEYDIDMLFEYDDG